MEGLEKKFAEAIKENNAELELKYAELKEAVEKGAKAEAIEALEKSIEDYKGENAKMQEQLDDISTQLKKNFHKAEAAGDPLRKMISDNFDKIKNVRKGNSVLLEDENGVLVTKAVGNMTTANITGDEYRDYSYRVASVPSQKVNVADLVMNIPLSGGTYTFPRETGSEGAIGSQTEGNDKSQIDYDLTHVDVTTDFIAGFAVYSKKMANNVQYLEGWLPQALRRDYWKAENSAFNTVLAAGVTASSQVITNNNKVEMLIGEISTLENANFEPNAIVVRPSDFWSIVTMEKSTGSGYGLPPSVSYSNGQLTINGIPVVKATWLAANKYYVGDFSQIKKLTTQGLGLEFSNSDEDNFRKNNITARIEAQVGLAIERTDAVIYGDFTST